MLGLKLIFGGDVRYFDLLQESAEKYALLPRHSSVCSINSARRPSRTH
jgi:hypothetical protein